MRNIIIVFERISMPRDKFESYSGALIRNTTKLTHSTQTDREEHKFNLFDSTCTQIDVAITYIKRLL